MSLLQREEVYRYQSVEVKVAEVAEEEEAAIVDAEKETRNEEKQEEEAVVEKAVDVKLTIAGAKLGEKKEMIEDIEEILVPGADPIDAESWQKFDPMKTSTQCIDG